MAHLDLVPPWPRRRGWWRRRVPAGEGRQLPSRSARSPSRRRPQGDPSTPHARPLKVPCVSSNGVVSNGFLGLPVPHRFDAVGPISIVIFLFWHPVPIPEFFWAPSPLHVIIVFFFRGLLSAHQTKRIHRNRVPHSRTPAFGFTSFSTTM